MVWKSMGEISELVVGVRGRDKCCRGDRRGRRLERRFMKLENIARLAKYPNQAAGQLAKKCSTNDR